MSPVPRSTRSLNPPCRMAALLALFADLLEQDDTDLAGRVLSCAWGVHERWPLDVAPALRGPALCALSDAEKALVATRRALFAAQAERVVLTEGWAA